MAWPSFLVFPSKKPPTTGCPTDRSHAPPSPRGSASAMTIVFVSIHLYRGAEERLAEDSLTFPQLLIPPTPIWL